MIQNLQNFLSLSNDSQPDRPPTNLAEMTAEITQGKGYVILPDLISRQEATEARNLILELARQEKQDNKLIVHGKKERLYGLIYKGDIFASMVQDKLILSIVDAIIGEDAILGRIFGTYPQPRSKKHGYPRRLPLLGNACSLS